MATDFIMPRVPGQQPAQQPFYPQQQQQQQQQPRQPFQQQFRPLQTVPAFQPAPAVAPFQPAAQPPQSQRPNYNSNQISPLSTSGNGSPTSPKTYITRQIRPMYMPAVLRPTEFPSKAPAPRPRQDEDEDEFGTRRSNSFMNLPGLGALGRLSRRSTADSAKCVDGNWNLDLFPKPTGAPTRKHWKPDAESSICDHATCKRNFGYICRRHHCRRCGNIFCDQHSAFQIPLDQDANYNPRGQPSRACEHCYMQFKEWRSRTNSQSSSSSRRGSQDNNNTVPETPTTPVTAAPAQKLPLHTPDAAHSVPRDWNWSTF